MGGTRVPGYISYAMRMNAMTHARLIISSQRPWCPKPDIRHSDGLLVRDTKPFVFSMPTGHISAALEHDSLRLTLSRSQSPGLRGRFHAWDWVKVRQSRPRPPQRSATLPARPFRAIYLHRACISSRRPPDPTDTTPPKACPTKSGTCAPERRWRARRHSPIAPRSR